MLVAAAWWSARAFAQRGASAPWPDGLKEILDRAAECERREDLLGADAAYAEGLSRFADHAALWSACGEFLRFYVHDAELARQAFERALDAPYPDLQARAFALRGLGELAAHAGRDVDALRCFEASLALCPLADTHRSLCHFHGSRGNHPAAADHARRAVAADPGDPIALLQYAGQAQRAGQRDSAAAAFARALERAGCSVDGPGEEPVHCCVLYNAAGYCALADDRAACLRWLEAFFRTPNHRHLSRKDVWNDPDFAALREDAAFRALLDRWLPEPEASNDAPLTAPR
ncbi:MAG: hypothetical protein AMXMBFR7_35810 [Planctomycetota bacterium]